MEFPGDCTVFKMMTGQKVPQEEEPFQVGQKTPGGIDSGEIKMKKERVDQVDLTIWELGETIFYIATKIYTMTQP